MRIDKYLTECGFGSRSEVKKMIKSGTVYADGIKVKSDDMKVDEEKSVIEVGGKRAEYKKYRYYVMNKPAGVITAVSDKKDKTVFDILPDWVIKKELAPVGRLDKDTEGVLVFTNDGEFSHKILAPKSHIDKVYYLQLEKEISSEEIERLKSGVEIEGGYITKEAEAEKIGEKEIYLTIREGKFHQVKQMAEAIGNKVTYLKRVKFGKIEIGDMEIGEVRELSRDEIAE